MSHRHDLDDLTDTPKPIVWLERLAAGQRGCQAALGGRP